MGAYRFWFHCSIFCCAHLFDPWMDHSALFYVSMYNLLLHVFIWYFPFLIRRHFASARLSTRVDLLGVLWLANTSREKVTRKVSKITSVPDKYELGDHISRWEPWNPSCKLSWDKRKFEIAAIEFDGGVVCGCSSTKSLLSSWMNESIQILNSF